MSLRFPDVSGLLAAFDAGRFGTGFPQNGEVPDFERKYHIATKNIPFMTCEFQARIHGLFVSPNKECKVLRTEIFAGVDEGFVFRYPDGMVHTHRIRFGSNRSPKWITKISKANGDNTERKRSSTAIGYHELAAYRTRLLNFGKLDPSHQHLLVGQSGQFWFVKDLETAHTVEIALYKAGRAEHDATSPLLLLAEIAPWGVSTMEEALPVIRKYEKLLGLTRRRVRKSNVELFSEQFA